MADTLTLDQLKEFKTAFDLFDKDGSDLVTLNELKSVMNSLDEPATKSELESMVKSNIYIYINII